jgi:transposase
MNSINQIGVDVSSQELVVSIDGQKPKCYANSTAGIKLLIQTLPTPAEVHLESSGGYEKLARRLLESAGFQVFRHNPLKVKRLAQAKSIGAKTDPVDAKHLAMSGNLLPPPRAKSQEREQLSDLSRLILEAKNTVAEFKKRAKMPEYDEQAKRFAEELISQMVVKIKEMEAALEQRIQNSALAKDYENLLTVPAIGPVTARILLCELPEDFRERTPKELSSYNGLAPMDNSSGQKHLKKRIANGNKRLKACLYMSAICAITRQDWAKKQYAKLKSAGKAHRTCIVAIMRRLLLRVVAVRKRGSPWKAEPTTH